MPFQNAALRAVAVCAAALCAVPDPAFAAAAPLTLTCTQKSMTPGGIMERTAFEIVYRDGAKPVLEVRSPDGTMALPARMEGQPSAGMYSINANGPGVSIMPDTMKMEACVAAKLKSAHAGLTKQEAQAMAVNACRIGTPKGTAPVAVDATVQISVLGAPFAQVFLSRAYKTPSAALGAPMQVDAWPMPKCVVKP